MTGEVVEPPQKLMHIDSNQLHLMMSHVTSTHASHLMHVSSQTVDRWMSRKKNKKIAY